MADQDQKEEENNEIVVWGDNEARIKTIQGWFGQGENLLKAGRILVGEGVLLKQCRKKLKPRQFFLFNDILMYANIIVSRKRYNKQRIIKLSDMAIEPAADEKAMQVLAPGRSFLVLTATAEEAKEWIFHIKMCITNLPDKPSSKPPSAAVWIPDKATELCMSCNTTKFTTFNRRHHCRKCGKVVCNACSSKKWDLPNISNKPSRVCDACFDKLSRGIDDADEALRQSSRSNASQRKAEAAAAKKREQEFAPQKTEERDFESEDELQTSAPQINVEKAESDSEDEGQPAGKALQVSELTMDHSAANMQPFNQNVRASLFFTNEDSELSFYEGTPAS